MTGWIELHDEAPCDLVRELELVTLATVRAQLKAISKADKQAAHLARVKIAYGGKLPVFVPEDKDFPAVSIHDLA